MTKQQLRTKAIRYAIKLYKENPEVDYEYVCNEICHLDLGNYFEGKTEDQHDDLIRGIVNFAEHTVIKPRW